MTASPDEVAVRFCRVCDEVVRSGLAVNKTAFCTSVGLRLSNYNLILHGVRTVCTGRLCDVVNVYGVSPDWLFLGVGSMFREV